jgi:hypothetical protein
LYLKIIGGYGHAAYMLENGFNFVFPGIRYLRPGLDEAKHEQHGERSFHDVRGLWLNFI